MGMVSTVSLCGRVSCSKSSSTAKMEGGILVIVQKFSQETTQVSKYFYTLIRHYLQVLLWSQSDWTNMTSICSIDALSQEVKIGLWQTQSNRLSVSSWLWETTWAKERKKKVEIQGNLAMRAGTSEGGTGPELLPILREVSKLRGLNVNPILLLAT